MKEQILSYVHFVATGSGGEQVDPQVASTASNTGDPTLTIIACLLALIAAIAGVIYFKKYRPSLRPNFAGAHSSSNQNSSFSGAKHMRSGATNNPVRPSVEDMHRGPAAKLSFVVFVVIAALAAVCAFASVQQNAMRVANAQNSAGLQNVAADTQATNKTNSDSQSLTVEPIVGTVDRGSQAISFAPSSITNNTERDIYVDATSLIKLAGIQDDDCTWTLKIDGTVVFEGKATQEDLSNSAANAASICIKAGATDTVELSQTGLTYQTALGLADKDALKIGFDVSSFKTSTKMNDPEHGSITSNIPEYVSSKATYQVKDGVLYVDQDEQFSAEFDPTLAYAVDYWTANGTTIAESTSVVIDGDIEFSLFTKVATLEAYACYYETASNDENIDAQSLYFYYDSERKKRSQIQSHVCYDMNAKGTTPAWNVETAQKLNHAVVTSGFSGFKPDTCQQWFDSMSNLKEAPQGCEYINTEECTSMNKMFYKCCSENTNLTSVPNVAVWNVKSVTDFSYIFSNYGEKSVSLDAVPDVSKWDTSSAEFVNNMFTSYGLHSIVLSVAPDVSTKDVGSGEEKYVAWDLASVEEMQEFFSYYGSSATTKNINLFLNWDLSTSTKLKYTNKMFMGSGFKTITCDKDWSGVAGEFSSIEMFKDCSNLVGGKGTAVRSEATDIARAKPDKGQSDPGYFTATS